MDAKGKKQSEENGRLASEARRIKKYLEKCDECACGHEGRPEHGGRVRIGGVVICGNCTALYSISEYRPQRNGKGVVAWLASR